MTTIKTKRQRKRDRKRTYSDRLRTVRRMMSELYMAANALADEIGDWSDWEDNNLIPFTKQDLKALRGDLAEVKDLLISVEDEL